jgi:hypothetical protein
MPATLTQMADGLESRLGTIPGLRVFDHVPDAFAVPCAFVMPETVNYWGAFAGGDAETIWTVTVVVGRTANRAAQKNLYEFVSYSGVNSIRAAIEGDRTLGGKVQTCLVESASNMRILSQADADYLAVDFRCRIHP